MTTQPTLFDLPKAKKLRDAGKDRAATERRELLWRAQNLAVNTARIWGVVTADCVYERMAALKLHPERLRNAAGSIFADKTVWEWTGEWRQSTRVSNRGRYIRVWRLKK